MTDDQVRRQPVLCMLRNWRTRHQHPLNFAIHMLGIPVSIAGIVILFTMPWVWGVTLFVLGYLLQYLGHCVEGNDLGEWAGIKRLLGLPYVGIAPQYCTLPFSEALDEEPAEEMAIGGATTTIEGGMRRVD